MEGVGMKEMCTNKKIGNQSVRFAHRPYFIGRGNIVGQKEGEGPLAACFDEILEDDMDGEKSWEKAECKMLEGAMEKALQRAELTKEEIDIMLSGDLLNQIMSSSFTARNLHIPFLGLYGACSTMTDRRRICRDDTRGRVQPFLYGGETVPDAGGAWQPATAVGAVDCDGSWGSGAV